MKSFMHNMAEVSELCNDERFLFILVWFHVCTYKINNYKKLVVTYHIEYKQKTHVDTQYIHIYVCYSENKYLLRISLAHPRDCHFAHVQRLPLSIEQPQTPFLDIRVMFMFVLVR